MGELKLRSSLGWGDFVEELRALPGARQVPPEHLPFAFVADQGGSARLAAVVVDQALKAVRRREVRTIEPTAPKPTIIMAQVAGSGTAERVNSAQVNWSP